MVNKKLFFDAMGQRLYFYNISTGEYDDFQSVLWYSFKKIRENTIRKALQGKSKYYCGQMQEALAKINLFPFVHDKNIHFRE